eukprot:932954-Prorocentrum_minimum.AAC.1
MQFPSAEAHASRFGSRWFHTTRYTGCNTNAANISPFGAGRGFDHPYTTTGDQHRNTTAGQYRNGRSAASRTSIDPDPWGGREGAEGAAEGGEGRARPVAAPHPSGWSPLILTKTEPPSWATGARGRMGLVPAAAVACSGGIAEVKRRRVVEV